MACLIVNNLGSVRSLTVAPLKEHVIPHLEVLIDDELFLSIAASRYAEIIIMMSIGKNKCTKSIYKRRRASIGGSNYPKDAEILKRNGDIVNRISTGGVWLLFGMAVTYLIVLLYAGMNLTV